MHSQLSAGLSTWRQYSAEVGLMDVALVRVREQQVALAFSRWKTTVGGINLCAYDYICAARFLHDGTQRAAWDLWHIVINEQNKQRWSMNVVLQHVTHHFTLLSYSAWCHWHTMAVDARQEVMMLGHAVIHSETVAYARMTTVLGTWRNLVAEQQQESRTTNVALASIAQAQTSLAFQQWQAVAASLNHANFTLCSAMASIAQRQSAAAIGIWLMTAEQKLRVSLSLDRLSVQWTRKELSNAWANWQASVAKLQRTSMLLVQCEVQISTVSCRASLELLRASAREHGHIAILEAQATITIANLRMLTGLKRWGCVAREIRCAVITLKSHLKGANDRRFSTNSKAKVADAAAVVLQGGLQGMTTRRRVYAGRSEVECAASARMQGHVRGKLVCRETAIERHFQEDAAAKKIQGGYRGKALRRLVWHEKTVQEDFATKKIQGSMGIWVARRCIYDSFRQKDEWLDAQRIQGGVNGAQCRQATSYAKMMLEGESVLRMQACLKGIETCRQVRDTKVRQARRVHARVCSWHQGLRARSQVLVMRKQRENVAAARLQGIVRVAEACAVKREAKLQHAALEDAAATRLQATMQRGEAYRHLLDERKRAQHGAQQRIAGGVRAVQARRSVGLAKEQEGVHAATCLTAEVARAAAWQKVRTERVHTEHEAAVVLQGGIRGFATWWLVSQTRKQRSDSAQMLQSVATGATMRRVVAQKRVEEEGSAIGRMKGAARGAMARDAVVKMKQQREEAAMVLQSGLRGQQARTSTKVQRMFADTEAAHQIQGLVLGCWARVHTGNGACTLNGPC